MNNKVFQFKVHSIRTMSSPYAKSDDKQKLETIYYLLVNMKDLPTNIPLDVNPREPKMTTNVGKALKEAVTEPETDFYLNNRGIVISAKSLVFDPAKSQVKIDLGNHENDDDKYQYGILDGAHTYTAIIEERDKIPKTIEKYVRVEVITNVQNISRLSDARNTSIQVSDTALFNLEDKFDIIKSAIIDQPFNERIAYKDNEEKDIHISELLRLIYAFDIEKYPDDSAAPIQSYSGKSQVFKRYKIAYDTPFYKSLTQELPKLVALYDLIEEELPQKYKEYKEAMGVTKSKFGKVRGIEALNEDDSKAKNAFTFFLRKPIQYKISSGYIYPIFGAFRSLLKYDSESEKVYWIFDPIEIWNEVGTSLAQNTFETSNNPQLAGKDKQLWLSNYRIVETQSLRKLLKQRK